jgi:branched-chain amino acid transport system substrate-binding protein
LSRIRLATVVWTAAIAASSTPASTASELKHVLQRVVGVLSGPASQWGIALRGAREYVAAEANKDETVKSDGQPVTVVAIDSKYTAEGAATAANDMAAQGINHLRSDRAHRCSASTIPKGVIDA